MPAPQRRCRICRTSRPKAELVRWVRTESELVQDLHQNQPGRGLYSCPGEHTEQLAEHKEKFKK